MTDDAFKEFGNRKVNLGNAVATERGALYILIKASRMAGIFRFDFAQVDFYLSEFFYKIIAYIISLWYLIAVIAGILAYKDFGKLKKGGLFFV